MTQTARMWLEGFIGFLIGLGGSIGTLKTVTNGWPEPWSVVVAISLGLAAGANSMRQYITTPAKMLIVGMVGLAMAGCASVQADAVKVVTDLSTFTQADLDQAIAMAAAASIVVDPGAPYRARCYATLKKYVPSGQTVAGALLPTGAVSLLEQGMELDARLRSGAGIPADVHADCAVLVMNLAEFAGRVGLKLGGAAGIPGVGAAGGLLGR